jgi:hypothetical protein
MTINAGMSRRRMERLISELQGRLDGQDDSPVQVRIHGSLLTRNGVESVELSIQFKLKESSDAV